MTRSICQKFVENIFSDTFYWFWQSKSHWWRHYQQNIYVPNSMKYENHVKIICVGIVEDQQCGNCYNRCNFWWSFHFCWNWLSKRCPKVVFGFFQFCVGGWSRGLMENTSNERLFDFTHYDTHMGFQNGAQAV